jgi:hypothetical protein
MTEQEKRIKLAEAQGLTGWEEARCLPDYFANLNAVHELEKLLTPIQQALFVAKLSQILSPSVFPQSFRLIHATAAQRAEALGLTLKLW